MKQYFFLACILCVCSCASQKNFVYFDKVDLKEAGVGSLEPPTLKVQPDDILAIRVTSLDGRSSDPFNLFRSDVNTVNNVLTDFLVDANGTIDYPGLGNLSVVGKPVNEVKALIRQKLKPFLEDAVVNVRITNFSVTVMGEVRNPSRYIMQGENTTLLEALGMAGDLTDFGDREHIVVIRKGTEGDTSEEINLMDGSVFTSEYYYLRQNDIIYVRPRKEKAVVSRTRPLTGLVLPVVGVLTSLASLIIIANR